MYRTRIFSFGCKFCQFTGIFRQYEMLAIFLTDLQKLNIGYFLIPSSTENNYIYLSIKQGIKYKIICSGVISV